MINYRLLQQDSIPLLAMIPNYNSTVFYYDVLSRLLFGKALIHSQVYLLKYIPPGSKIMIVGGGTGWILDEISKLYPSGLDITYVEMAEKMVGRAMKRHMGANVVDFVNNDVRKLTTPILYDVVITPFLFDNFSQENAGSMFEHIHKFVKPEAIWLYCDFQLTGKWWQNILLRSMLIFFRTMCNIEANKLPDMQKSFRANGYKPIAQQTFFGDFVISEVYNRHVPRFNRAGN
jgi:ubiquinone/menaquinone biosynthesis C-methylase UbiE